MIEVSSGASNVEGGSSNLIFFGVGTVLVFLFPAAGFGDFNFGEPCESGSSRLKKISSSESLGLISTLVLFFFVGDVDVDVDDFFEAALKIVAKLAFGCFGTISGKSFLGFTVKLSPAPVWRR